MQYLFQRFSTILLLAITISAIPTPAAAQSGPPERLCILLTMLGVPCDETEDDDAPPAANIAAMAYHSQASVFSLPAFAPVARSHSTLTRTATGATATMDLAEIRPRNAFTLWWVVFNNPEACSANPCPPEAFGNEETGPSFFSAGGGRVSDEFGHVRLEAGIAAGAAPEGVSAGDGLTAPSTAEVQLVVRDHGSAEILAEAGMLEAALSGLFTGVGFNEDGEPVAQDEACPFTVTDRPDTHDCREPAIAFHLPVFMP